jgi:hypothetical protein
MTSVDYRNREDIHGHLVELESVKLGTEVSFGQILKAIKFKAHWFLVKYYCFAVQRLFPEFHFHHRLLRIALAELDEIEGL